MQKIRLILTFYLSIISSSCLSQEEYLEIPPVIIRVQDKSYIKLDFSQMKEIIPTTTNSTLIIQEELKEPIGKDFYELTPQEAFITQQEEVGQKMREEDRKKIHSVVELFCGNRRYLKYRLLQQEKIKSYNKKLPFDEYMLLIEHKQREGEEYASKWGFNREDKNNISLSFNILSKYKRWLCYNTFDYKHSSLYFPYSTQTQIEDINYYKFLTEFDWYLSEDGYIKFKPEIAFSNYNSKFLKALIEYIHKHKKQDYKLIWGLGNILGKLYDTSYNLSRFYGKVEGLGFRRCLTSLSLGIDSWEYNKLSLFFLLDIIYKYKIVDEGFLRLKLENGASCQQEEINNNYIQVNHLKEDENITKAITTRHRTAKLVLYLPLTGILTINSDISYKNISQFLNIEPKDLYIILKDIGDVKLFDYNIDFIYSLSRHLKQIVSASFIHFNKKIANMPAYKFKLTLEYKKEDLFMNLSLLHAGERYKETNKKNKEETNKENKLDNFLLLDSYLSKKITDNISFYLLGRNLLNTRYMLYKEYPGNGLQIEVGIRLKR